MIRTGAVIPPFPFREQSMNARLFRVWLSSSLLVLVVAADEPKAPPEAPVVSPVVREVTDYSDFGGRTEAAATVEVRARVSGYLEKAPFREGGEVKQGDLLFEIDPRPYQAELKRAEANVALSEAHLQRLDAEVKRAKELLGKGAMGQDDYAKIVGDRSEAEAAVVVAKASCDAARLTLAFTKVTAPLSGRIGRQLIDPGNLVRSDETLLATIVSQSPMHVYFDIDERTYLQLASRELRRAGKTKAGSDWDLPVMMGLADEEGFPHRGKITFVNNRVDPNKGTLTLRAVLPNENQLLVPGLFARVRLMTSEPHKALLVPEEAVATENGQSFVLVVGEKNVLERRKVRLGSRQGDLRVVEEGLLDSDRLVSKPKGLRPGMAVKPQ
jgi:RND family efflux transporter MFP subunit